MDHHQQMPITEPIPWTRDIAGLLNSLRRWAWFGALADGRELDALQALPAAQRPAPEWLLDEPEQQARVPCELIGAIELTREAWDDYAVMRWLEQCPFDAVKHLTIYAPALGERGLGALLERWPGLESVSLRKLAWEQIRPDRLAAGLSSWHLHRPPQALWARWADVLAAAPIASLRLSGVRLEADSARAQAWAQVRGLCFEHCEFAAGALTAWLEAVGRGLDVLDIVGTLDDASAQALHSSAIAPKQLRLFSTSLGEKMLIAMASSGALERVEALSWNLGALGDVGIDALASALSGARSLDLGGASLGDEGCDRLLAAVPGLQQLSLAHAGVSRAGLEMALEHVRMSEIVELDLSGIEGASQVLAASKVDLEALNWLGLRDGAADGPGLAALLARALPRLCLLDVSESELSGLTLDAAIALPSLRYLEARFTQLRLDVPARLFSADALPSLTTLHLDDNRLSDAAADALAGCLAAAPIRSLDLGSSIALRGDAYGRALAAAAGTLVHFVAGHAGREQPGLVDALAGASWPALSDLDLVETMLSAEQWNRLAALECPRLTALSISFYRLEELETLADSTMVAKLRRFRAVPGDDEFEPELLRELFAAGKAHVQRIEFSFL
ncbi:hypothetical protein [Haliangium ochraceum]|nr:hypothetical protein [Haliangium ochraceum]